MSVSRTRGAWWHRMLYKRGRTTICAVPAWRCIRKRWARHSLACHLRMPLSKWTYNNVSKCCTDGDIVVVDFLLLFFFLQFFSIFFFFHPSEILHDFVHLKSVVMPTCFYFIFIFYDIFSIFIFRAHIYCNLHKLCYIIWEYCSFNCYYTHIFTYLEFYSRSKGLDLDIIIYNIILDIHRHIYELFIENNICTKTYITWNYFLCNYYSFILCIVVFYKFICHIPCINKRYSMY